MIDLHITFNKNYGSSQAPAVELDQKTGKVVPSGAATAVANTNKRYRPAQLKR